MSRKTCITAVGLLVGALTSGMVHALPVAASGPQPSERAGISGVLTTAVDRLAALFGWGHSHPDPRMDAGSSRTPTSALEKEGGVLDPNGHH